MRAAATFSGVRKVVSHRAGAFALVAAVALTFAGTGRAHAFTVAVNGTCTLREAVDTVNNQAASPGCMLVGTANPDVIQVPSGTFQDGNPLELNRNAVVRGNGVGSTILRSTGTSSFFFLRVINNNGLGNPIDVTFDRVTIDKTSPSSSLVTGIFAWQSTLRVLKSRITGFTYSAISSDDTDVVIEDPTIENNSSMFAGAGVHHLNSAVAVWHVGLNITRSTIANNTSSNVGGGIYFAGHGTSVLTNVTIAGNAAWRGGGIGKDPTVQYLFLNGTTVANNTAAETGGGIWTGFDATAQGVKLDGTIVGQNSASGGSPDIAGPVNQFDDSMIGNASGTFISPGGNGIIAFPKLELTLRDLGGTYHTKVLRPLPGSPAIDAIINTPIYPTDQRGVRRPQLGATNSSRADMGAFESSRRETESLTVAAKSSANHVTVSNSQFSAGQGRNLQATAANHFVTYSTGASMPSGTYNVKIGYKRGPNGGQFRFALAGSAGGTFTNVGGIQNGFASPETFTTVDFGNVTFGSTGTKFMRFMVTGPGSQSGFQIFPDFVELTRQ